ncbi:MAG TPA: nucleotide exchange factor GrpE [Clostridiales bacterium]|nr:nucleotide exchange factor GrpE [Clostridiales bacterium]
MKKNKRKHAKGINKMEKEETTVKDAGETENAATENETVVSDAGEENAEVETVDVEKLVAELAALKKEAEAEKARAAEMTDSARRLQAEFDNYRKRMNDNSRKVREDATAEVLVKVVPVLDTIAQALNMIDDEKVAGGVKMIGDEITKLLGSYGVVEIEAEGKEFDPKLHEAIMQMPAETEEQKDTVKQVFQKGYKMGDKVIRPARVIVNK